MPRTSESGLDQVRERIRQRMLEAHERTTEERNTYEDGYFNGLLSALDEFLVQEKMDA